MSEKTMRILEAPFPLSELKRHLEQGSFQRGPERYGLIQGSLPNGQRFSTERSRGKIDASTTTVIDPTALIVSRPAEDNHHETVILLGRKSRINPLVTLQAAAVPDRPEGVQADLRIGDRAVLEEGVEVYNRNFHPLPGEEQEGRQFSSVEDRVRVGRYSLVLMGARVDRDIAPFSIVRPDGHGGLHVIADERGLGEHHEALFQRLKKGLPAIDDVAYSAQGETELGVTCWTHGEERRIVLGKCNFIPNGPLLVVQGNGEIKIGEDSSTETAFVNRRSQLWAIDHPIGIQSGVQVAWDVLIATSLENKRGPVTVGKNAWIGSNVIIYPNVTIGEGAIIAAGSIVTENIPPRVLAAGRPAIVKRSVDTVQALRGKESRFD